MGSPMNPHPSQNVKLTLKTSIFQSILFKNALTMLILNLFSSFRTTDVSRIGTPIVGVGCTYVDHHTTTTTAARLLPLPCWTVLFRNNFDYRAAAIAPWFRQRLPSCGRGFESHAHYLHFFQFVLINLWWEKDENKQKEAGICPFFKKTILAIWLSRWPVPT